MNPPSITYKKVQVVICCIKQQKKYILLLKTTEPRGSFWQNVTGGVEQNESYLEGGKREMLEETGIDGQQYGQLIPLNYSFSYTKNSILFEEQCLLYYSKTFPNHITLDPKEHSDFIWLPIEMINADNYKYNSNFEAFCQAYQHIKNEFT